MTASRSVRPNWIRRLLGYYDQERRAWALSLADLDRMMDMAAAGSGPTAAGLEVGPESSLQLTAVWACVRILSETLASLPLMVYEQRGDGGKERAQGHPLYRILHDEPNPEMTAFELRETLMGHLALWGNAYCEIQRERYTGDVAALWPLRPDRMDVVRGEAGRLAYSYRMPDGSTKVFDQALVLHLRGLSSNGIIGYSPIRQARQAVGLGLAAEQFGAAFFGNGTTLGTVLEHPGVLGDTAYNRLRESWEQRHMGLSNAHRIAILEEGMKVESIGVPPEDAQFLETRKFQVTEIARLFRVPPHMVGDLDRATFSNIEHQGIEFVMHTVRPWTERLEQRFELSLIDRRERGRYFVEHVIDGLLRGDVQSRYAAYAVGRQWGWFSVNDVRALENLNPVEGGDEYLVPMNMVEAGEPAPVGRPAENENGNGGDEEEGRGDSSLELGDGGGGVRDPLRMTRGGGGWVMVGAGVNGNGMDGGWTGNGRNGHGMDGAGRETGWNDGDAGRETGWNDVERGMVERRAEKAGEGRRRLAGSYQRALRDVAQRVVNREANDVRQAAKRLLKGQEATPAFLAWLEEFYFEHTGFIRSYLAAPLAAYGELVAQFVEAEIGRPAEAERLDRFMEDYTDAAAVAWAASHRRELKTLVSGDESVVQLPADEALAAVDERLGKWQEDEAEVWSREQVVRAGGAVAVTLYAAAGISRKRWRAFGDNCPYCASLNGKLVGTRESFLGAGVELKPEGAERPLKVDGARGHPPLHGGCDCMVVADVDSIVAMKALQEVVE